MRHIKFTDTYIKSLKPREKKYYVREAHGFTIRILPTGAKTWLYIYTYEGKRKELNIGTYPAVSLAAARSKFNAAYELHKQGNDPAELERQAKEEADKVPTVKKLIKTYLEKGAKPGKKECNYLSDKRTLEHDVLPVWGDRKAGEIRRRDAIELIEDIAERAPGQARNVMKVCRRMYNFGIDRTMVEINPFNGITRAVPKIKPVSRSRVLTAAEVKLFLEKMNDPSTYGDESTKRCLQMILLTGQRPGECAGMHTDEIKDSWWTIPAERAKTGIANRVYLTDTALQLIGDAKGFVFKSPKEGKCIGVTALSHVIKNNRNAKVKDGRGYGIKSEDGPPVTENVLGIDPFTPHDLRRTCRTFLSEIGILREVAEAVIGHKPPGIVGNYDLYQYEKEKQQAMEAWERKLKTSLPGK